MGGRIRSLGFYKKNQMRKCNINLKEVAYLVPKYNNIPQGKAAKLSAINVVVSQFCRYI